MRLSRQDWVKACEFRSLSNSEVLEAVRERARRCLAQAQSPVVLLDLDYTLYHITERTRAILQEGLSDFSSELSPAIKNWIRSLEKNNMGFSLLDSMAAFGLNVDDPDILEQHERLKRYWFPLFFSNQYLHLDEVYPGAVAFAKSLSSLGARIVYLTARHASTMESGTQQTLKRDGFALGENETLIMKVDEAESDSDFKAGVYEKVAHLGRVVASFENEPKNLAALFERFPKAMHVFADTLCSQAPARPLSGIFRIDGYT